MRIESSGHSRGNPRFFELIENAPKTGKSPTVWAWPEMVDFLKIAGQPVAGPWPPHQEPRPDPEEDSLPVAVPEPDDPEPDEPATAATTTSATATDAVTATDAADGAEPAAGPDEPPAEPAPPAQPA